MNQEKIGKFISECRKSKKLTQESLAEKLGISDRAISKWERGLNLPDASLMLELCNILGITVNELLTGEIIEKDSYMDKAEEKLIEMKHNEERIERKLCIFQTILTSLCIVFSIVVVGTLVLHMAMNYFFGESYSGVFFEAIFPMSIILMFISCFTSFILYFREKYEIRERGKKK